MLIARPNRQMPPRLRWPVGRGERSHLRDARAFVAALLLWGALFYVSKPALSHADHCMERGGAISHCVPTGQ